MEIFECIGEVNILAAGSYKDLLEKTNLITGSVPIISGDHLVMSYNLNETGPFYFSVESKKV